MKIHTLANVLVASLILLARSAFAQEMPPPPPMGPGVAVIDDLEQLRHLYAVAGHPTEIVAVYREVLSKTQDPGLRHYVFSALADVQSEPANPEPAIATLRESLAEDVAVLNQSLPRAPVAPLHGLPPLAP